ncbi:MAG TPA: O-acetyl-ADP-ribose deacetylase [Planctomycetota bacterium]|jgi:O-acetyl-ADP-ribose deacetylase (regulator of RNase III)|nr:O-acetyl-ADP-ribose deacetylase [Planctomycetota bacterium]OQC21383.1 MAG: O-acetyl-ADP-ribose deacetylase [Planctomycetes bacterium ADurb.Bin069]NMD35143.1 O-acetyl-ADP-ribose deacetylase [Planctomycetota bacterium]HNR97856.1 O-acetyl-ADP-ribose deacetylase [Planctomycetota bacterium]HNU24677.1 O-acetyl-ADP-ribose deacetylase [Planctomycetota bacterium]
MARAIRVGGCVIRLLQGDITACRTDAIVNAANSTLMGGGGVDGAIHRAGGPAIAEECARIPAGPGGRCPPGRAVATGAGKLGARFVIHAVGPVWRGGGEGEEAILADAYRNALLRAVEKDCASVAFPAIATGAYRFPMESAARIAAATVKNFLAERRAPREVLFVLFSAEDLAVYERILEPLAQNPPTE